jgi:hypothetical protein
MRFASSSERPVLQLSENRRPSAFATLPLAFASGLYRYRLVPPNFLWSSDYSESAPGLCSRQLSLTLALPPLVGLVRCPALDMPCVCPLPATLPSPSACRLPAPAGLVPPSSSLTTAAACSTHPPYTASPNARAEARAPKAWHRKAPPRRSGCRPPPSQQAGPWVSDPGSPVAGLLHPAAEQGSLRFSRLTLSRRRGLLPALPGTNPEVVPTSPACHRPEPSSRSVESCVRSSCADPRSFPQRVSHPSKKSSRQQPHPVARTVALLWLCLHPLPNARGAGCRWRPSTSGPCSAVGSVARPTVAGDRAPSPSMGLVPLQGSGAPPLPLPRKRFHAGGAVVIPARRLGRPAVCPVVPVLRPDRSRSAGPSWGL